MTKGKLYLLIVIGSCFSSLMIIGIIVSLMGRWTGPGKSENFGGSPPGAASPNQVASASGSSKDDLRNPNRAQPAGYWIQRLQDANATVRLEAAEALARLG